MPQHGICQLTSALSRRPVSDLPRFEFFRLPRGVSRLTVRIFPATNGLSRRTRHGTNTVWYVWTSLKTAVPLNSPVYFDFITSRRWRWRCPCPRHEGVWGSGSIALLILILGSDTEVSGHLNAPTAVHTVKEAILAIGWWGWVGPTGGLDTLEKWAFCYVFRESNHDLSVVQHAGGPLAALTSYLSHVETVSEFVTMKHLKSDPVLSQWLYG